MKNTLLSIDCGTQSLRALLFDLDGSLIDKVKIEYTPYFSVKPGWAEQNPEIWWNSLKNACKLLQKKSPAAFRQIAGVGITTQRDSLINLGKNGKVLRPATIWLDQRKTSPAYRPGGFVKWILKAAGAYEALMKTQMNARCNWIMKNQPDIWKETEKYIQVSGYLNYKLTGTDNDSVASQIAHLPFNYQKMRWCKSRKELNTRLFPVDTRKLSSLIKPGDLIGKVTGIAAKETHLPEGLPVIACGSDKGCETIGMGVINTKMASLSFGTTATVQTTSSKYFEPLKFMPAYPAPIPDRYNPEVEIFRGYWMITWFKEEFGYKEVMEAEKKGIPPEVVLNQFLKEIPPGSMGLMVQPYWGPGLKNPSAKGTIIGFGDVHKRGHLYKSVIEGLAYALLDGLHSIEKAGKCRVNKVAVSGGASQSDEICQISADIFNLPLVRGKTFETAGLGAAIVTAVGLGLHENFDIAIKKMVHYDKEFIPDPGNVEIYKKLYKKVYLKIYDSVKQLYKEIRDITGYPEKID